MNLYLKNTKIFVSINRTKPKSPVGRENRLKHRVFFFIYTVLFQGSIVNQNSEVSRTAQINRSKKIKYKKHANKNKRRQ